MKDETQHTRREFIKKVSLGTAGLALGFSAKSYGRIIGANQKVKMAVIGLHGRGKAHIRGFSDISNVDITHVCDVDDNILGNGLKVAKKNGQNPKPTHDFRKILNDKNLDAISVATPDHWHATATVLGCSAGKHVYVEKPCGHNPEEGIRMVEAAEKYNRLVQMGSQRRSWPNMIEAVKDIKNGMIGHVHYGSAWYANNRKSIGQGKRVKIPSSLDWDLWQGPAPREAFRDNVEPYNWHWFWIWGTGEACNNGTHELDMMRWAMDVEYPKKVDSGGGRYFYHDDWQSTDTQNITYEFPGDKAMSWEGRSCNPYPEGGASRGFKLYGENGTLVCLGGNAYTLYGDQGNVIKKVKDNGTTNKSTNTTGPGERLDVYHFRNFIDAIRENKRLNASITEGHKSVLLPHLGNIAQRTGHTLHCAPDRGGRIINDPEAMKLWYRKYQPGWELKARV